MGATWCGKDVDMKGSGINKDQFFRDLDGLGYVSDDAQNPQSTGDLAGLIRRTNTAPTQSTIKPSTKPKDNDISAPISLKRHSSMVSMPVTKKPTVSTSSVHSIQKDTSGKRRSESFQSEQPKGRKKRRTQSVQIIPEADQIFKGLTFFFVPNNDISPARRLRIQRSREYGASWAQEWSADVTHVIVDKGLDYKEVLKVLTPEQLSHNAAIVNQDYVSDCLVFKSILLVSQGRFRVGGTPPKSTLVAEEAAPAPAGPSVNSINFLRVKEPGRRGRRSDTPSRNEETPTGEALITVEQDPDEVLSHQAEERAPDYLDELMLKIKATGDLPLDEPDDEGALDVTIESVSEAGPSDKAGTAANGKVPEWQKNFACMQKPDGDKSNSSPNARTIDILQKMADYYDKTADNWRTMAYRKAIAALRKQKTKVCTKAEALAIPGIGQRLADKIEEIVCTDRLRRLENINLTPEDRALQLFLGVYGAGFTQASKWVAKGYRSLEDLHNKAELTTNQKLGVERYHDFQQRIPQAEVARHGEIVRSAVQALDRDMEVMVTGSYRRGAADCGDIDILITKTSGTIEYIRALMIENVVPELTRKGFLKASLATTSRGDGSKWHGASALPGTDIWRRIDLLFVPGDEIGAALLYFTGNDIFNRSLRLLARKKGMRLNQHGLYKDVLRGSNQVKLTDGTLLEGRNEKRIFEILGVPWRPPRHRIC